jgi:hypothetical protein
VRVLVCCFVLALVGAPSALADDSWLPHPKDAEWTYQWTDTVYSGAPAKEKVTVKSQAGRTFTLAWSTLDQGNPPEAPASLGNIVFQETTGGLLNTDWSSTLPPAEFPILCPRLSGCNNSLSSTWYLLVWGNRAPMLAAPLLKGVTWTATGGADGDVTSFSQYLGREPVKVPAFEQPVIASKVRTDVTQAGALGDPYGSGVRTVWWVYGVGPVKVQFQHAGGTEAPVTTSELMSTNQKPVMPPQDANYFPMRKGAKLRYSWTNSKYMKKAAVQDFVVDDALNNSARFSVKHVRGPIRVAGAYGFSLRTDGLTSLWGATQAASLARFPALGPRFLAVDQRRHFFTPFDLMVYGFGPILPASPAGGMSWAGKAPSRDYSIFGVKGSTRIIGIRTVKVPAGTFKALAVRSTLDQQGFRFGSGVRTSYFAANKGLVKLVFAHRDGSTSVVQLLR